MRLLRTAGVLSIRDLTGLMNVSHMTVRRDIAALEGQGRVVSVQGGVRLAEQPAGQVPRERGSRSRLELPRKRAIARRAAELVRDGMVIFVDAGTTCEQLVPHLATRTGLTVVTNDFLVTTALFDHPGIETIHTGGAVDVASGSASGPLAAATVATLSLDVFFLSSGAWDLTHGVTTPSTDKLLLKRAAMDAARECVLLADSTKFGAVERFRVTPLDRLDALVTDDDLTDESTQRVRDLGVTVHLAPAR